jgi:hypothetical protein
VFATTLIPRPTSTDSRSRLRGSPSVPQKKNKKKRGRPTQHEQSPEQSSQQPRRKRQTKTTNKTTNKRQTRQHKNKVTTQTTKTTKNHEEPHRETKRKGGGDKHTLILIKNYIRKTIIYFVTKSTGIYTFRTKGLKNAKNLIYTQIKLKEPVKNN